MSEKQFRGCSRDRDVSQSRKLSNSSPFHGTTSPAKEHKLLDHCSDLDDHTSKLLENGASSFVDVDVDFEECIILRSSPEHDRDSTSDRDYEESFSSEVPKRPNSPNVDSLSSTCDTLGKVSDEPSFYQRFRLRWGSPPVRPSNTVDIQDCMSLASNKYISTSQRYLESSLSFTSSLEYSFQYPRQLEDAFSSNSDENDIDSKGFGEDPENEVLLHDNALLRSKDFGIRSCKLRESASESEDDNFETENLSAWRDPEMLGTGHGKKDLGIAEESGKNLKTLGLGDDEPTTLALGRRQIRRHCSPKDDLLIFGRRRVQIRAGNHGESDMDRR